MIRHLDLMGLSRFHEAFRMGGEKLLLFMKIEAMDEVTVLTVRHLARRCSANRYLYRCTCIRINVGIEHETLY